jgi:hypothetical protein
MAFKTVLDDFKKIKEEIKHKYNYRNICKSEIYNLNLKENLYIELKYIMNFKDKKYDARRHVLKIMRVKNSIINIDNNACLVFSDYDLKQLFDHSDEDPEGVFTTRINVIESENKQGYSYIFETPEWCIIKPRTEPLPKPKEDFQLEV